MTFRRGSLISILIVALALFASACSSSDAEPQPAASATQPAESAAPLESYAGTGPYGVGITTIDIVDTTRPTAANGEIAALPERTMKLDVWYPAAAGTGASEQRDVPVDDGGPYPLIVFAHGLGGLRSQSASYTRHLASHGYLVASPDFPSSNLATPGGARLGAVTEQPRDVSFVIDRMLAFNAEAGHRFEGAVDGERLGVTGHSLGGLTTLLTAYGPARDERVDAFLPMAAPGCFLSAATVGDDDRPILFIEGSKDLIVNTSSVRHPYDLAHAPRYYVKFRGGTHLGFADFDITDVEIADDFRASVVGGDQFVADALAIAEAIGGSAGPCVERDALAAHPVITNERQRELMRLVGALFFDAYLRDSSGALAAIQSGDFGGIAPEVTVESE